MKVKLSTSVSGMVDGKHINYNHGEIVELEDGFASRLIASGQASLIAEDVAPEVEKPKAKKGK